MAVGDRARQWRLGDHCHPAAHIGFRTRQGTVHEAEDVLRGKRIDSWTIVEHLLDAHSTTADELELPLLRRVLVFHIACG